MLVRNTVIYIFQLIIAVKYIYDNAIHYIWKTSFDVGVIFSVFLINTVRQRAVFDVLLVRIVFMPADL